jgi:hypothetical protein
MNVAQFQKAAQHLFDAHERRERFVPLPQGLGPQTLEEAYAIQDEFVALRAQKLGGIAGYKIALSSLEMQRFVGVDRPQAGCMLESTLRTSPATVRAADYCRLIVEFEIALKLAEDLPVADAPYSRERVAAAVGAVMPAMELADDRDADAPPSGAHRRQQLERGRGAWPSGRRMARPGPRRGARHRQHQRKACGRGQGLRGFGAPARRAGMGRRPPGTAPPRPLARRRGDHRQPDHLEDRRRGRSGCF